MLGVTCVLRLWKVFYVLLSKIRTPGQGREASRVSIVRGSRRGPTAHKERDVLSYFFSDGVRIPTKSSLGKSEARCTTVSKSKGNNLLLLFRQEETRSELVLGKRD